MRRQTTAAIIAAATVAVILLSGFVTRPPIELDDEFVWEPQRIGDQGAYSVTLVDGNGNVLDETKHLWDFHIWQDGVVLDDDGVEHHALKIAYGGNQGQDSDDDGIEDEWDSFGPAVYAFDLETHELVSYSYVTLEQVTVGNGFRTEFGSAQHFFIEEDQLFTIPCAMFSQHAGSTVDLDARVSYWTHCGWHDYWSEGDAMHVSQTGTFDGRDAIILSNGFGPKIEATLVAGIPYPVEIKVEQQDHRGQFHIIRLENFTAGTVPIPEARIGLASQPFRDLPIASWDRYPFGLVDTPYPLQDAIDDARNHPDGQDLATWMDEHLDWYVFEARNHDTTLNDVDSRQWDIGLTDGEQKIAATIQSTTRLPPASTLAPGVQDPTSEEASETNEIAVSVGTPQSTSLHYARDDLPSELPTLSGIEERWRRYSGEVDETSTMSFQTMCTRGCENLYYQLGTGIHESDFNGDTGTSHTKSSRLRYMHDPPWGEQWDLSTYYQRSVHAQATELAGADASAQAIQSSNVWTAPNAGFSAAVGTTGALAVVAVLFAPLAKSGGFLGLFSRIQPDAVLMNPTRNSIYTTIQNRPGIHLRQLRNELDIGSGTADHHVRKLVGAGLVSATRKGNYTCLFPKGSMDHSAMAAVPALKAAGALAIVKALRKGPALQSELAAATGLSKGTLSYHLKRLQEAGAVEATKEGRTRRIHLTPLGRKAMASSAA